MYYYLRCSLSSFIANLFTSNFKNKLSEPILFIRLLTIMARSSFISWPEKDTIISPTFIPHDIHKKTWPSPNEFNFNQIDQFLVDKHAARQHT